MGIWEQYMATISSGAVVRYFNSGSSAVPEYFFEISDDELGMENPDSDLELVEPDMDQEAPLLEVQDDSIYVDEGTSTKLFMQNKCFNPHKI